MNDTISAIATPIGEGAIAVVRVSGPQALDVASRLFRLYGDASRIISPESFKARHAYFGVVLMDGKPVDEVILTVFRKPKSYTREDLVEISCHGGVCVPEKILTATIECGCRPATHGEFTRRAFINGRIDLTQAEAVAELIRSTSDSARRAALSQLGGSLSHKIRSLHSGLLQCLASVEACLDFPEEEVSSDDITTVSESLRSIQLTICELEHCHESSVRVRNGRTAVIAGIPNSGKSTLFNALLGQERAIVSTIPGTTRDSISELLLVGGRSFKLVDTAGLRSTEHEIERQGIERTIQACNGADVVLMVLDPTQSTLQEQISIGRQLEGGGLVWVLNKCDLVPTDLGFLSGDQLSVRVSARTGDGLDSLRKLLSNLLATKHPVADFLINARHADSLSRCKKHVMSALHAISSGFPLDAIASDVRAACASLDQIVGSNGSDAVLDSIFSSFCIGK